MFLHRRSGGQRGAAGRDRRTMEARWCQDQAERAGLLRGAAWIVSALLLGTTRQRDSEGAWNLVEAAVLGARACVTLRRALSASLRTRSRLQSCGNGCTRWLAQASASQALAPAAQS